MLYLFLVIGKETKNKPTNPVITLPGDTALSAAALASGWEGGKVQQNLWAPHVMQPEE